ncbi:RNA polymerase sigma factor [Streptomyces sp. NPDC058001]|uniref:RNA polymerase sigma factor n=1 Tax=Streptomyces sp. NPDC058001 TaxID=3346300 RepID=UPI0036EFB7A3
MLPADFCAFHQLYRARYVRWAEAHLGSRADAEEAVDSAFEQLAIDWAQVLRQPVPEAYAWKVVKNRTIDVARDRGRRPSVVDVASFETRALHRAVDPIGELEESLSIYQAINQLPERQFDVIVLRYCLGYDTAETPMSWGSRLLGSARPPATPDGARRGISAWMRTKGTTMNPSPIERTLAKARLENTMYSAEDIEAAERRIAARVADRLLHGTLSFDDDMRSARAQTLRTYSTGCATWQPEEKLRTDAAGALRALCRSLVSQPDALHQMASFVGHRVLDPDGAVILGCVLQLAARDDSARFWWQFGAGAGEMTAACCLYLHHLSLGEAPEADWWRGQMMPDISLACSLTYQ